MTLASWGTQCDSQIFSHFEPFFCSFNPCLPENQNFQYNASSYYRFTHIFWKLWSYNAWLSFWAFFTSHPFLTTQKIIILKNKTPGDIIILHRCTINDNHMIYGSWDTERDRQNFLSFWVVIFCLFIPPPNEPKNQSFEKMKTNPVDIIILHKSPKNRDHML